jgi:hypothetical protein
MASDELLDSTARLGKYAAIKYMQSFDAKWINDNNIAITIELEPKHRIEKPKVVKLYLTRSEIKKLRAALENR